MKSPVRITVDTSSPEAIAFAMSGLWIPVSEMMPDSDQAVLVLAPGDDEPIWIGYHDGHFWCSPDGDALAHEVTHWMPFPDLVSGVQPQKQILNKRGGK